MLKVPVAVQVPLAWSFTLSKAGVIAARSSLAAGAALKLEASKTAEIEIRVAERKLCSAVAPWEVFCRLFIRGFF
jgi:hypothetical protein